MPRTTVFRVFKKKLAKCQALLPQFIKLPNDRNLEIIGNKFATAARNPRFDKCVGAIDGCHVPISCPVALHEEYITRKLDYAIVLEYLFFKFISGSR